MAEQRAQRGRPMANTDSAVAGDRRLTASRSSLSDLTDSRRGWLVVAAAFIGLLFSMGTLLVYSFGILALAMAEDLGFSRTQLSSIFLVFSLACVLAGPVWGALTDRFGGRAVTMSSSLL